MVSDFWGGYLVSDFRGGVPGLRFSGGGVPVLRFSGGGGVPGLRKLLWLHGGRYASCVHAGGLSCLNMYLFITYKNREYPYGCFNEY